MNDNKSTAYNSTYPQAGFRCSQDRKEEKVKY